MKEQLNITPSATIDFIIEVPKKKKKHVANNRLWLDIQRKHRRHNPRCAICGINANIEVHHILPVSLRPDLQYEESNLISLCRKPRNCHLVFGHLGNFSKHNPNILQLKKF